MNKFRYGPWALMFLIGLLLGSITLGGAAAEGNTVKQYDKCTEVNGVLTFPNDFQMGLEAGRNEGAYASNSEAGDCTPTVTLPCAAELIAAHDGYEGGDWLVFEEVSDSDEDPCKDHDSFVTTHQYKVYSTPYTITHSSGNTENWQNVVGPTALLFIKNRSVKGGLVVGTPQQNDLPGTNLDVKFEGILAEGASDEGKGTWFDVPNNTNMLRVLLDGNTNFLGAQTPIQHNDEDNSKDTYRPLCKSANPDGDSETNDWLVFACDQEVLPTRVLIFGAPRGEGQYLTVVTGTPHDDADGTDADAPGE